MASNVKTKKTIIELPAEIAIRDLAEAFEMSPVDLLKALISNGIMASITESVDFDTAAIIAEDLDITVVPEGTAEREAEAREAAEAEPEAEGAEEPADEGPGIPWFLADEDEDKLTARAPVVTVMGHVDHGKTSLLDAIREARVAAGESGGITQHIGAYTVERDGGRITFIDTPGHEAFTAMRARGAQATDIAVIVVAADDGVMPQTREAIDHARAAHVPIIVAVNKIDLEAAKPEVVQEQLSGIGLIPDAWGGDTFFVPVSATEGTGLDELLDAILLVAEDLEPKANPNRLARGTVLEGRIDPQRGVIADLLVQSGTLERGAIVVVDDTYGRVRAMFDETGERIKSAGPSTPVEIMGLSDVPDAGARFEVVKKEKEARARSEAHADRVDRAASGGTAAAMTLDELFARAAGAEKKSLRLVVKTDVQGTLEPVIEALEDLSSDEVDIEILHNGAGDISESDVNLAAASDAIILGFRVSPDGPARRAVAAKNVEVREYEVIYKLVEDVQDAVVGMHEPVYEDVTIGKAEVRAVFSVSKVGRIAGCQVTEGVVRRNARARVMRGDEELSRSAVSSLKRFTDDVREVREGFECGIGLSDFSRFEEGDVLEFFVTERVKDG